MSYGYIYKTTNLINNQVYIGKKQGVFNPNYLGSGLLINKAIKKHGRNSFKVEFLTSSDTREGLNILEIEYIRRYRSLFPRERTYNIADGGDGGAIWYGPHTEEAKAKIKKNHSRFWLGKHRSEEIKLKIKNGLLGRKQSLSERLNKSHPHKPHKKHDYDICECIVCVIRRNK